MKLLGLTDDGTRFATDAASGSVGAAKGSPPPAGTAAPGTESGKGTGQGAQGAPDGSPSFESLSKKLDELAKENETLRGTVRNLETESIGRKKKLQALEGTIGDLSPSEVQERLKRAAALEEAEAVRKGEWEKLQEASRGSVVKERDQRIAAEKREAERVIERDILAGAMANHPLPQSMTAAPGTEIPILAITRSAFEYDRETGDVLHKTERNPETGKKLTPEQFFARERTKSLAILFASGVLPGGGASAKDAEGAGGDVAEIAYDDPEKVNKAAALDKAGKKYRVVRSPRA